MADFRSIAPFVNPSSKATPSTSQQLSQDSSPSQTTGTSANEGTLGKSGGKQSAATPHRRRRIPGQVSNLACNECRRARAKCNGERPNPCRRCVTRDLNCAYEFHTKTHKDDLIKEIAVIKAENADLQTGNRGLQEQKSNLTNLNMDLQSKQDTQTVILDMLTNNGHDREIIKRLQAGDSRESVAQWLLQQPHLKHHLRTLPVSQKLLFDIVKRVEDHYEASAESPGPMSLNRSQWTSVTRSQTLIGHLFELYFTWVHPIHMLFSEFDFLDGYESNDETHCSCALVNSVCAMACLLLENPDKNAEPIDENTFGTYQDAMQLRDAFMAEARALLQPDSYSHLTSLQAFAVIFLVDLSSGKARSATSYIRSAADHLKIYGPDKQKNEAAQLSYWGIHTLNTVWSGFTYQKPFAPISPSSNVFFDLHSDRDDGLSLWHSYRQPGDDIDEIEDQKRQGFSVLTACHHAKLFRIVHYAINIYCGARGKVTAEAVIGCYKRYLDWSDELPAQLKIEKDSQPLPHILSLHVQYYTALIQLLVPLLRSEFFSASHTEEIRRMVIQNAKEGLDLLLISLQLYSSRYHMPITTFCVVHLGDTMVRYCTEEDQESRDKAIRVCLDTLQQTRSGFGLCGPLQQMFRWTVQSNKIILPENIVSRMGSLNRYGVDDVLDACTRLDYSQPIEHIIGYLHPQIADTWHEEWRKQIDGPRRVSNARLEITSLLNR